MSLILDALRKSERSRQETLTGQVGTVTTPARTRLPVPWATLIGILLIANALVLGVILWRGHTASVTPIPELTKPAPSATVPASPYRPAIRSLAEEAAAVNNTGAAPATPAAIAAPVNAVTSAASGTKPPKATVPASPRQAAAPQTAPAGTASFPANSAPALATLPIAFQESLPPLHLDVHSYARNPAERFVVINMQRYQAGDTLKEGPKVIAIVPDGVILEYQGHQFLLPRP